MIYLNLIFCMNKIVKIVLVALVFFAVASPVAAQVNWGLSYAADVGLGTAEIRDVAVTVIRTLLGLLGIVALIIILIGGFTWMTAAGNEENITKAKKTITAGVTGLIIVFFSYAIVMFVFNVIGKSLTNSAW